MTFTMKGQTEKMSINHTFRTLGLALVAALALSVAAVAGASADEFKTSGSFPVTISGSGGTATFETSGGETVTCEKSSSTGSIESSSKSKVTVTYSSTGECQGKGSLIGNGGCGKTITTKELSAEPGDVSLTKEGLRFSPSSGSVFATVKCPKLTFEVEGHLVCEDEAGPSTTGHVFCKGTAGKQEFTAIEEVGPTNAKFTGQELSALSFIKEAQITTETLTYGASVSQT
ncbi:MAG TPA: hypothetical protein VGY30_07895 [Solirubrobacteraceae bacterium]|jgi:hypothetical protein|nr:hypothetical protein [Solirubrobacteraceae bacterium]